MSDDRVNCPTCGSGPVWIKDGVCIRPSEPQFNANDQMMKHDYCGGKGCQECDGTGLIMDTCGTAVA